VLGLDEVQLTYSRESLRRYGNLSSVSILTVLELALAAGFPLPPGKDALVLGIGPGLSLELALLTNEA
jgi:predicted naringenin-chalcone synthase